MSIRPNYMSIMRGGAVAAVPGECPGCGNPVEVDEPIVLYGASYGRTEDEEHLTPVDLTDAEWFCQRPHGGGGVA